MNCPDCSAPLAPRREHGIEIDPCSACAGVWFDAGELELHRAAKKSKLPRLERLALGVPAGPCPRCPTTLLRAARPDGLELAACPHCKGIWVPSPIARKPPPSTERTSIPKLIGLALIEALASLTV